MKTDKFNKELVERLNKLEPIIINEKTNVFNPVFHEPIKEKVTKSKYKWNLN